MAPYIGLMDINEYFNRIQESLQKCMDVAKAAREKGKDPTLEVEIKPAGDIADRVEKMVGPPGVAEVIRDMFSRGLSREETAFKVAGLICDNFFGDMPKTKKVEQSIKTGTAIITSATVAGPLEGIEDVRSLRNEDGTEYIQVIFAGPCRSLGGTAMALSVVLASYAARRLGFAPYKATSKEINRYIEEMDLYDKRQYIPKNGEVETAVKDSYIAISSGPGQSVEKNLKVALYQNIDGIDDHATNYVRDTACLILCEGLFLKSAKLQKIIRRLGLEGWDWLGKVGKGATIMKGGHGDSYLEQLIGGRAVLSYAEKDGGFSLRYGRSRTGGLYSFAVHPSVTYLFNNYPAIGVQLKTSFPSKGATVQTCDSIEPPVVRLKNGDVIRVDDFSLAEKYSKENQIDKILFAGDLLVSFGDVCESGNILLPGAWCYEWWVQYLEKELSAGKRLTLPEEAVDRILHCSSYRPSAEDAFKISKELGIPLHPAYTYQFSWTTVSKIKNLHNAVKQSEGNILQGDIKDVLEEALIPHKVTEGGIELDKEDVAALRLTFASEIVPETDDPLEYVCITSGVFILNKHPTIIGARVGRPPNIPSELRAMKPPIHFLFALGLAGGTQRLVNKAMENEKIKVTVTVYRCPVCCDLSPEMWCYKCNTSKKLFGDKPVDIDIPIKQMAEEAFKRVGVSPEDVKVKGVKGLTSPLKIVQPIEKGIIRAKYDLVGFKDGSIRTDLPMSPLTQFRPKEADISIEKVKELGYDKDIHGSPLERGDQLVDMYPQDMIISEESKDMFLRIAKYTDEMLTKIYGLEPFYNAERPEDLIGHIFLSLSPHTSVTVPLRLIGFTKNRAFYNSPLAISMRRRDCLASDEVVTFVDKNKHWHIDTVEALYNRWLHEPTVFLPSYDPKNGRVSLSKVVGMSKRLPNNIIRLTIKSHGDIFVTPRHKVLITYKNKQIKIKLAKDIVKGDKLLAPLSVASIIPVIKKNKKVVDLIDMYSKDKDTHRNVKILIHNVLNIVKQFIINNGGYKAVGNTLGYTRRGKLWEEIISLKSIPLGTFLKLEAKGLKLDRRKLFIRYRRLREKTPVVIPYNNLFFILGIIIADGNMRITSKQGYQINISEPDKEKQKIISTVIRETFNLQPCYGKSSITICSHMAYDIIKRLFGVFSGAYEKRVPSIVIMSDTETIKHFLGGYIAGDGSVDSKSGSINISSANRCLIGSLYLLSQKAGLHPSVKVDYSRPFGIVAKYSNLVRKPKFTGYCLSLKKRDSPALVNYLVTPQKEEIIRILKQKPLRRRETQYVAAKTVTHIRTIKNNSKPVFDIELNPHKLFTIGTGYVVTHNSDGDSDCFELALPMLIDFSEKFLPAGVGRLEDAPIITIKTIDPAEVDPQAYGVDTMWRYPLELYEAALRMESSGRWRDKIECIGNRLGTPKQFVNYGFTHDTMDINVGAKVCAYQERKITGEKKTMLEKINEEWDTTGMIRGVDRNDVMTRMVRDHLIPDFRGNLKKYSTQIMRCTSCGRKYRRMPLSGKCACGRQLIQTVHKGGVVKYLDLISDIAVRTGNDDLIEEAKELAAEAKCFFGEPEEKEETTQTSLKTFSGGGE